MTRRNWVPALIVLAVSLLVAGCSPAGEAVASIGTTEAPPVVTEAAEDHVQVEGVVWPARSVTLQAAVGGTVVEVLAVEGQQVATGTLVVALDATDAELAVQRAEAGLAAAEAQLALAQEGIRPEQLSVIEAQLAAAEAAVAQAIARRDAATAGLAEADALDAQAQVADAALAHEQAQTAHEDTLTCYEVTLPDGSNTKICPALGTFEEITRYQEEAAHAGLLAAQAQLDAARGGVTPQINAAMAGVQAALANRDGVEAQLELAQAGARAEALAVAEAGVQEAAAASAQARGALELSSIEAPFSGVVTDLHVEAGDTVAQSAPLATLATLDRLQIRTTDLTEMDVVKVAVGQAVVATFDAQPAQPLAGTVVRVDPQGTSQFGDVIYTAIIELDEMPSWARWGMTVQVESSATADAVGEGPPVAQSLGPVLVEAQATPSKSAALQFAGSGKVVEVLVGTGDTVQTGELLARLDPTHQALAVATAESALATARARLALAQAGPRSEDIAIATADLATAKAGLNQAVAARDALNGGMAQAELAAVQAQVDAVRARRREVEAALRWAEDDGDDVRANTLRDQLQTLDIALAALEARLAALPDAAAARLREATGGVSAAQAQVRAAEAELALAQAGPTAAEIDVAEAAVQMAEAELAAAQVALARTELRAPFPGTITQVMIESGDIAGPGRPVFILADLEHMRIETTDLSELDIVRIYSGQPVAVTIDAIPGRRWEGQVVGIKHQAQLTSGDVLYPVTIELDEPVPGLLWGMSAAVTLLAE